MADFPKRFMHRVDAKGEIESQLFEAGEAHPEGQGWHHRPDTALAAAAKNKAAGRKKPSSETAAGEGA